MADGHFLDDFLFIHLPQDPPQRVIVQQFRFHKKVARHAPEGVELCPCQVQKRLEWDGFITEVQALPVDPKPLNAEETLKKTF